ncbi:MAG: menaquinone biosynthetic enzyme MqnA/MqnD family protein [Thermodesulfobacteriota bacterium]
MLKLGDVPFLNSKPLFYPIEHGLVDSDIEIVSYPPNILSKQLYERKIDLGLIPVAELLTRGSYKIVPDISISSFGKVDSVILISNKELKDIKTVALDKRSQSSSNLIRVIFNNFLEMTPEFIIRDYDDRFLVNVDAGMIIGDAGLKFLYTNNKSFEIYDLGELWTDFTGLPFVYAVLAVNEGVDLGDELDTLTRSKKVGAGLINEICDKESIKIGISKDLCVNYVSNRIHYDLDEEEVKGILEFAGCLNKIGIKTGLDKLEFYKK